MKIYKKQTLKIINKTQNDLSNKAVSDIPKSSSYDSLKNQNKSFTNNRLVLQKFTLSKNSLTTEEKKVY